jgi:large repetitive protein
MKASLLPLFLLALVARCAGSSVYIINIDVPNGTVGTAYSATVSATGGCTPYKWAIPSGKLPPGITDKPTGNTESLDLTGTPTEKGSYTFTVSVTDCSGHSFSLSYEIVIQAGAEHIVSLNWNPSKSKDVAGYNVYRGPNGNTWTRINVGLIAATDYDDSTVANGTTYYYSATTVNISGEESTKSTSVKVTIPQ